MKCPYCGNDCAEGALYCEKCKQPLPTDARSGRRGEKRVRRTRGQRALVAFCWIACFVALGIGAYKLVFWIDSYQITRLYARGKYTPTLNAITMDDGRVGHALVFYGQDGDLIYLPELDESLCICGGIARLEIADADWFGSEASEYDYADISFAPVLIHADGSEVQLPVVKYTIDVPESPLDVISPEKDGMRVVTSTYPLELKVVPGSSLFVNGEDVTDRVDRGGSLSAKLSVRPIGDNSYTVIVRTPQHKETRRDITLYRQAYDIEIELDSQVSTSSSENIMTVSGKCEPGAMISVDTAYMEDSLAVDMTTGSFSFIAKLEQLGDNVVRFRATKEGKQDAVISFSVNYKPTLAAYSAKAWRMDYDQLRLLFEQWTGRVFLCKGTIVDSFTENDVQYLVMDVGEDSQQLVVLQNYSTLSSVTMGPRYAAYADVTGRYLYKAQYYPMLAARYLDYESAS